MTGFRLDSGGTIDRSRPIGFKFNGRAYRGFQGDTLASALMAAGVSLVGRSFKLHRPRGIVAAGGHEPNALVQLGIGADTVPNVPATLIPLTEGLVARSINAWPSVDFDIAAVNDRLRNLLIAGFYYKTFMWPGWHLFEPFIRRAAGLGRAPDLPDPDRYAVRNAHCDVLVVGSGGAGLMAAQAAVDAGARVILIEADPFVGGSLLSGSELINGIAAADWAAQALIRLTGNPRFTLLTRTAVVAYHDHNYLLAVETIGGTVRECMWKLRARQVVLATGAIERPLVFANNDRPGVMLADAISTYVERFGVAPGRRGVFFTTNDSGWNSAFIAARAGIEVAAIVDPRESVSGELESSAAAHRIETITGGVITSVAGTRRVKAVSVSSAEGMRRIACDLVGVSGGWSPVVQLFSQSGGRLRFDDDVAAFVPDLSVQSEQSCGAAGGTFGRAAGLADGWRAGADAAARCGMHAAPAPDFRVEDDVMMTGQRLWSVPGVARKTSFVDLQTDVTLADLDLAVRENYRSVEHVKRYTTLGMGTDQGKTGNVNAIGVLGELMEVSPREVGTTRFRPPTLPASFGAFGAGRGNGERFHPRRMLPAHEWHVARGALFEDYGWERPTAYPVDGEDTHAAAQREALHVRQAVGLLDGSPLGKIELRGPDAGAFLDHVYVGNASNLKPGRVRYGLMLNENGAIFDDGVFVRLAEDHFLLNPSSSHAERVAHMLEDLLQCEWPMDVVMQDVTNQWAVWTVAGPRARDVLAAAGTDIVLEPDAFPHLSFRAGKLAGMPVRIQRVSFSGEISYEISVAARSAAPLGDALMRVGAPMGIAPYGIEALEILRTEKGYIHVGGDTDSETQPADIGMGGAVAKKQSDFIGRRSLTRSGSLRPDRKQLVGLKTVGSGATLPMGAHIRRAGDNSSDGFVTSSYFSPILGRSVALALLSGGHRRSGERVEIWSMGKTWHAEVVGACAFDPTGERLNA